MGKSTNERVSLLLKTLKIDEIEAAKRIGKQPIAIYRITKNENKPTKSTLQLIADGLGANYEWLINGEGAMLSLEKMQRADQLKEIPSWKDEAYMLMKDQLKKKDDLIEKLVSKLMGDKNVNFLKLLNGTGPAKRALRSVA